MYKTLFIKHTGDGFINGKNRGYDMQMGKLDELEIILNDEYNNGWDFISMVPAPYPTESARCNYILIFKKR